MWTVLDSTQDWDRFRAAHQERFHVHYPASSLCGGGGAGPQPPAWPSGPRSYPCLVAAHHDAAAGRVLCAWVYPDDARDLLRRLPAGPAAGVVLDRQRSLTATILALYHFCVETGLFKEQPFADLYQQLLVKLKDWEPEDLALTDIAAAHRRAFGPVE